MTDDNQTSAPALIFFKEAYNKYNNNPSQNDNDTQTWVIPSVSHMTTIKRLYKKYPKLKNIKHPRELTEDLPITSKLFTPTEFYTRTITREKGLAGIKPAELKEQYYKLIIEHCYYLLNIVMNQYHPDISYDFLREAYTAYPSAMGPFVYDVYQQHYEYTIKNIRHYLLNYDENFQKWISNKYANHSTSDVSQMHDFAFWSKDLCDANDIVTHFLPNKVKTLYQQHVLELIEKLNPKTKKQWNLFFTDFDKIYDKIVDHLESKETDPLYLNHIQGENVESKQEVIKGIIVEEKFTILFTYAYEILLSGNEKTLAGIKKYFDGISGKIKLAKRNTFFDHLKESLNKKIVEPNAAAAIMSTAKLLDIYITLFTKLDELKISIFNETFREALSPILNILLQRSDIFTLLSYCFYTTDKVVSDLDDHSDIEALHKFRSYISNDQSLDTSRQKETPKKNISSWFKNNYLHNKVYSEETLRERKQHTHLSDMIFGLKFVKYNPNQYVKQERVMLQVINNIAGSNKEKFLTTFISIYHHYLLSLCDSNLDDWKYPFTLLLKILFKGGIDDSAEDADTAVKTMILDMAVNTHDFKTHVYADDDVSLAVLAGEYWNLPKSTKCNNLLEKLLEGRRKGVEEVMKKYESLHAGQELSINGQRSTMRVELEFDDGRVINERCSVLEGSLLIMISEGVVNPVNINTIKAHSDFTMFGEHEIESALRKWEDSKVLHRTENDEYLIIEDLNGYNELHHETLKRKRVVEHEPTNQKKPRLDANKEDKINSLYAFMEQLVVSLLEARPNGVSPTDVKEWLIAVLPDYSRRNIPKLRSPTTTEDDITMEDFLDHLVIKRKLKKSKSGLYYNK